jgi:hypothetical protein
MMLQQTGMFPRSEKARLVVIAVVGQKSLGPNEHYFPVEAKHLAVVARIVVQDGKTNVAQNVVSQVGLEYSSETLLGVQKRVELQKMILTRVPRQLQLGPDPQSRTQRLGLDNTLSSAIEITVKVHGPLIQVARGNNGVHNLTEVLTEVQG